MRARDVRIGEMYLVEVPHRLPPARYPHTTSDLDSFLQRLRLDLLRGGRFQITVTGLEVQPGPSALRIPGTPPDQQASMPAPQAPARCRLHHR